MGTLTYEFFPNLVYNISFRPKCSKDIPIDSERVVKVYLNGSLLPSANAPEDFDESIVEQKHAIRESVNSVPLKFRIDDRRKGKVYLKNFRFLVSGLTDSGQRKEAPQELKEDPKGKKDNGTDPQNQEGRHEAGEEVTQFDRRKNNKFASEE